MSDVDPFTAFNFEVVLGLVAPVPGVGSPVCEGAFSECDGLQLELEPKTVVQGGATDAVTQLMGQGRAGQLTLRRGMTARADLWAWMAAASVPGRDVRADGRIVLYDAAHEVQATFLLSGCLPVRVRGPGLNAQTGLVAVEELGLAVGHLALAGGGAAGGLTIGAGVVASAGVSLSAGAGAFAGVGGGVGAGAFAGAQVSGGIGLSGQLGGTVSGSASASAGIF
ncbi:MAG TPA: phage tail protein [Acidimicrobiales bacterium]|nr:phage tail protein [Acidimicrobiales bacterium]